jgi:hypothetical protein
MAGEITTRALARGFGVIAAGALVPVIWILLAGVWNDAGAWDDNAVWKDAP